MTLLGLYQDDHTGSTANFLPVIGTLRDNPGNPRLPRYLFVGKPVMTAMTAVCSRDRASSRIASPTI